MDSRRTSVILMALLVFLPACSQRAEIETGVPSEPSPIPAVDPAGKPDETPIEADPVEAGTGAEAAERRAFREEAGALAAEYAKRLKAALGAAIEQGGPAQAIAVCSEQAPEIAREVSTDRLVIHRVGTRVRNVQTNTPTEAQRAVLNRLGPAVPEFAGTLDGTLTYMKAIVIQEDVCLKCHGPRDAIDPEVLAELGRRYPDDQATGYRQGDLRGAFVVERRPAAP